LPQGSCQVHPRAGRRGRHGVVESSLSIAKAVRVVLDARGSCRSHPYDAELVGGRAGALLAQVDARRRGHGRRVPATVRTICRRKLPALISSRAHPAAPLETRPSLWLHARWYADVAAIAAGRGDTRARSIGVAALDVRGHGCSVGRAAGVAGQSHRGQLPLANDVVPRAAGLVAGAGGVVVLDVGAQELGLC
jgi:hypothetical protein